MGGTEKSTHYLLLFSAKFESSQNIVFILIKKKMYGNIFGFYEKYLIYLIFLLEKILCKGLEI